MSSEESHGEERLEILHEFRALVRSPGWARLAEVAKEQIELREHQILANEMASEEEVNEVRRLKYERSGMKVLMLLPNTIIEQYEAEIDHDESTEE